MLFNSYLGATNGLASEGANLALDKLDYAILSGMDGEIAASVGTRTSNLSCANLANNNLTSTDLLATKALNT